MKPHSSSVSFPVWAKTGLWLLLAVVLGLGMLAYTTPGMRLNWETIAAMCGL